jgi:hypothetical protein
MSRGAELARHYIDHRTASTPTTCYICVWATLAPTPYKLAFLALQVSCNVSNILCFGRQSDGLGRARPCKLTLQVVVRCAVMMANRSGIAISLRRNRNCWNSLYSARWTKAPGDGQYVEYRPTACCWISLTAGHAFSIGMLGYRGGKKGFNKKPHWHFPVNWSMQLIWKRDRGARVK